MAVDTKDKRFSMLNMGAAVPRLLPDPDGSFDAGDRSMFLSLYSGIALAIAALIVTPAIRIANVVLSTRLASVLLAGRSALVLARNRTGSVSGS